MDRRSFLAATAALAALSALPAAPARAAGPALPGPLVSAEWLRANLDTPGLVIVDIRGASPDDLFAAGHVPGAVWSEYAGGWRGDSLIPGTVPDADALAALLSALGIGNDSSVVVVPAGTGATEFGGAARVYWTLKYAGVAEAAILDGGWNAWTADTANPVATGVAEVQAASFTPTLDPSILATTPQVSELFAAGSATFLDARAHDRYMGEAKSAASKRAGHIPGALNLDNAEFYDPEANRLKRGAALESVVADTLSDRDAQIVTYCEAGHWSATNWFVMHELLGYTNIALYAESMPGWTADDARPVEQ